MIIYAKYTNSEPNYPYQYSSFDALWARKRSIIIVYKCFDRFIIYHKLFAPSFTQVRAVFPLKYIMSVVIYSPTPMTNPAAAPTRLPAPGITVPTAVPIALPAAPAAQILPPLIAASTTASTTRTQTAQSFPACLHHSDASQEDIYEDQHR